MLPDFYNKPRTLSFLNCIVFSASLLIISPAVPADTTLDEITVIEGVEERLGRAGRLKDDVIQSEVITQDMILKKQAGSITQAIKNEPGVKVSTECSVCGVKRIMINGLKGEHTTLMIDGVANSSMLEGFYGFDAIPTAGVDAIEISRGTGAALTAPEAIGGVVNVITAKPLEDTVKIDLSQGTHGYRKYQIVGKKLSEDKRTRVIIAGQTDNIDQHDQDNNDINEAPQLENRSIMMKLWHDFSPRDSVSFRVSDQVSDVFGGPIIGGNLAQSKPDAVSQDPGTDPQFIDGNVNNKPDPATSTARDWLETIRSTKQEHTIQWIHEVNDNWNTVLTGSYVKAHMDAIYEGITYRADQNIHFLEAKANYLASNNHLITIGLDYKLDKTKTNGTVWQTDEWVVQSPNDAYENSNAALYVRDIWTPSASLEISSALRVDHIDVKFTDQDRQFNETMIAPRVHIRYDHSFMWTSRLSFGQGYRVPLQFFESDHGIIDQGFAVAVDKLETSNSARYTLSYSGVKSDLTFSISSTQVENLAVLETISDIPTLISTDFTSQVSHVDLSGNYIIGEHGHWSVSGTIEVFHYDENYRNTFVIVPVEERLRLALDYSGHGWEGNISTAFVGSRDYGRYPNAEYFKHYDKINKQDRKGDQSPDYVTVDAKLSKQLNKTLSIYAGVNNLFDYTQTSSGDSPYFYNENNEWDVVHIWGPLRGRVVYAGITVGL